MSFVFRYRSLFVGTRSNQTLNVGIKYLKCGKFEGLKLIDRIYFNPFVFTDRESSDFVSFVRRFRSETSFASVFSYVRLNVVPCERKGAKRFAFKNDKWYRKYRLVINNIILFLKRHARYLHYS